MSKSILFVDEEQFVHKALQRSFRKLRKDWDMRFVTSPVEAVKALAESPADVLITETVFSGQSGLDLLKVVRDKRPHIVRIILSGYSDRDVVLKSVDLAHQYLAKPCEDENLRDTIQRAFVMKELLEQGSLKEAITKIDALPSLPSLYTELVQTLESEESSLQTVGEIIAKDIGLTAKVLKLVNSSFFSLQQRVASPAKAVSLLGLDLVKTIVLTSGTFDRFSQLRFPGFSIDRLWDHAAGVAGYAKCIAQQINLDRNAVETAFMAGLLHDIGKLLVAAHLPDQFRRVLEKMRKEKTSMIQAEGEILGTSHAAIGAYLLGLWGLPESIITAAAYHHAPGNPPESGTDINLLVHVANAFANTNEKKLSSQNLIEGLDYTCLEEKGWLDRIADWRKACAANLP